MDKTTMGEGGGGFGGGGESRDPPSWSTNLSEDAAIPFLSRGKERPGGVGGGGGVQVNVFFFSFDVQWAFTVILSVCMLVA